MKVAFACVENSCRSQMAEAIANKLFSGQHIEFVSAGTDPAKIVDQGAIKILKQQGIEWTGKPKSFAEIGKPDILITMGCDVECPIMPGVKLIAWDIPDPKGKESEEYLIVLDMIKSNLLQFMNELRKQ